MKLGSETGSVMNHLYSRATIGQPEPAVGMGVTFLGWTDRRPGTIVSVLAESGGGKVWKFEAQEDDAYRVDNNGMSECQEYRFERAPSAPKRVFRIDNKGRWRESMINTTGRRARWVYLEKSQSIVLGRRECYHDFSF